LKTKLFVGILLVVLALGVAAPLQAKDPAAKLVIDIQRTASAGEYGTIHVSDKYAVLNNGTTPVSSLDFAVPRVYRGDLYYAAAKDEVGRTLTLEADVNKTSEFYWMRVQFAQQLENNKTYVFTVSSVLYGPIRSVSTGFEYNFSAAPILSIDAKEANVTFLAPTGSTFVIGANSTYSASQQGGYPSLTRTYAPWRAYTNETFYAPYTTVNQFLLDMNSVERDIIIDNLGSLSVRELYEMHNPSVGITSLTLTLPDEAYNVMAYDEVGALWATPQNPSVPYQVQIQPRYTLGIRPFENFTFTLTYSLPQSKYLKQLNWLGSYNLTFPLLDNKLDVLFKKATVRIITPEGVSVTYLKLPDQSPVSDRIEVSQDQRTFVLQGFSSENSVSFGLNFNYLAFWSAFGLLPWIVALEAVIAAFAAVILLRRGPELAVPIPVEKLREFVGLYDERLALTRELVVMEEEVGRGGLVKHEFRRRSKVMELRLDEINKALMQVKVELRTISPRYDELIRRTDRAEAEIEASRASLNQVRGQYRAGKTTRETYDTMMNDIAKRIDRAEETLETILITLREEAR
jgi:hypothetical protein